MPEYRVIQRALQSGLEIAVEVGQLQHRGSDRDSLLQLLCGAAGTVFLDEIQRHAHQHDRPDDHESGDLAGQRGYRADRQQYHHQRISEMAEVLDQQRSLMMVAQRVGAELRHLCTRVLPAQPSLASLQS